MKSLLKHILPWHLRQTLAAARSNYARRKPPFEGIHARFDEVPPTAAWHARNWIELCRRQAEKWRAQVGKEIPESSQPSKALLPVLAAACAAGGSVRILDFGGGSGLDYAQLLASLGGAPDMDIRYHVVDMAEACEEGRRVWADDGRITFSPDLPGPGERFDIVYSFGAVHMAEDTAGLAAAFAAWRPAFLLFCKTPMHEGPSFVRKQVNMGREMENPQWALGFRDFVGHLDRAGYVLTFRGYGEDAYNVDNYPLPYRAGRTTNLLFRRRRDGESA